MSYELNVDGSKTFNANKEYNTGNKVSFSLKLTDPEVDQKWIVNHKVWSSKKKWVIVKSISIMKVTKFI